MEAVDDAIAAAGCPPFTATSSLEVETPWGDVPVRILQWSDGELLVIDRHHSATGRRPPHRIEHRAHVHAATSWSPDLIVSVCSVGTCDPGLGVDRVLVVDDTLDLTGRVWTFHDDDATHASLTGADPKARQRMAAALTARGHAPTSEPVVYAQMPGPRFETAAEIRALQRLGASVVGMTMAAEVALCAERDRSHVGVALLANWAAGADPEDGDAAVDHIDVSARSAELATTAWGAIVDLLSPA